MRALRSGLVVMLLCAVPSIAAAGKPKVWILDLDGDGPIRELTAQIRDQATTNASPYALHNEADSVNRCGDDVGCLARAGSDHDVDFVIAGHLLAGNDGFDVALVTVEASSKRVVQRWQTFIAGSQVGPLELRGWAATAYGALAQEPARPVSEPVDSSSPQRRWKVATAIGGASTAALAIAFIYYFDKIRQTGPAFQTDSSGVLIRDAMGHPLPADGYGGYCQHDPSGHLLPTTIDQNGQVIATPAACANASTYATMARLTGAAGIVALGFTGYSAYRAFVRREPSPRIAKRVIVTPVVSADTAGALLHVDW
jgi:hypothetical protein